MATELAQAYVQIIPSAKGISNNIEKTLTDQVGKSGDKAGNSFIQKFSTVAKAGMIAAGALLGKTVVSAFKEGAALEQSIGGIETLFKGSYGMVEKYANNAYKTAGLSANQYMEQVTSFSASLLQSLDGDTNKAAKSANQALIDMSDNANKMGTDMEMIQWAYQGFAKQNYTMLDNLKLGYGGTKTEMERLLADAEKLSGQKYDISNLNDVYEAIHVIQEDLGITGTTAKEAATTFTGSFNSMKAAASNLLGTMALGDDATMKLETAVKNLLSTTGTFLFKNAIPMLADIAIAIPKALFTAIGSVSGADAMGCAKKIISSLSQAFTQEIPQIIQLGLNTIGNLVIGLINGLPKLLDMATQFVNTLSKGIESKGGELALLAMNIILKIAQALIVNLPKIVVAAVKLVASIVKTIIGMRAQIADAGKQLMIQLAQGIAAKIAAVVGKARNVVSSLIGVFRSLPSGMAQIGRNLVAGIWNGISSKVGWIKSQIRGFVGNVKNFLKKMFGIHSPSTLMRDEIGVFLAEGIGVGFTDGMHYVQQQMENAIPTSFNINPALDYKAALEKMVFDGTIGTVDTEDDRTPIVIEIPLVVEGKEIARLIIDYVEELLNQKRMRDDRKKGIRWQI